ncbi:hypothetical protein EJB05_27053 [Eragrostis curvula]|uniref:F-box domain-containing protein n=1 Tax=Eragrostis curvula TaxID=38414 RepID=A0A5J9UMD6_9POAL|nr:hypothetical protein EJB05_27053 [Eragrostis curvula]
MGTSEEGEALSIKGQPEIRINGEVIILSIELDRVSLAMELVDVGDKSTCLETPITSPCQHVDYCNCSELTGSQVQLPEDILHRIHALMPMQDAAQAACVSSDFLRSWRSYPKLILCMDSLGIKEDSAKKDEITRDFIGRVEQIMQNHSGMGVKKFSLQTYPCSDLHPSYVDHWLQIAAKLGIEELELLMFGHGDIKYNFPCSFLSSEWQSSVQSFILGHCSFHSAAQIGCMGSLKFLDLRSVHVTGEELYGFLSNACALENLYLSNCKDITFLKIPHLLQRLNILHVFGCKNLEMIDSSAPNLSTFTYAGRPINISLGDALQVRKVIFRRDYSPDAVYYASTKLPFIAPYLETLVLSTRHEKVNTPPLFGRFLHLKYLEIQAPAPNFSPDYDFCSLVSFLDASPTLNTFILRIEMPTIRADSIVDASDGDSLHQRCVSERCHDNLKKVMITGFCSAKSMIALTVHIIEKTKSLECLTLDTTRGHDRRYVNIDKCLRLSKDALVEAEKALVAIRRYVEGRVPSTLNLKVIEPCSKCIY